MHMVGQRAGNEKGTFMAPETSDSTLSGPPGLQLDWMKCGFETQK